MTHKTTCSQQTISDQYASTSGVKAVSFSTAPEQSNAISMYTATVLAVGSRSRWTALRRAKDHHRDYDQQTPQMTANEMRCAE